MSRTLKFRAWDKLAKQFTYPDQGYQGHYVLDLNGRFQNLQNGSGGDEYVVQQFTGLHSLDGKEIWEGDLVLSTFEELTEVYFDSKEGSYRLKTRSNTTYQIISPALNEKNDLIKVNTAKTVIGNIFENSEFLNNEK